LINKWIPRQNNWNYLISTTSAHICRLCQPRVNFARSRKTLPAHGKLCTGRFSWLTCTKTLHRHIGVQNFCLFFYRHVQKLCTPLTFVLQTLTFVLQTLTFSLQTLTFALQTRAKTLHALLLLCRTRAKTLHALCHFFTAGAKTLQRTCFFFTDVHKKSRELGWAHATVRATLWQQWLLILTYTFNRAAASALASTVFDMALLKSTSDPSVATVSDMVKRLAQAGAPGWLVHLIFDRSGTEMNTGAHQFWIMFLGHLLSGRERQKNFSCRTPKCSRAGTLKSKHVW
jgi:hypothetical protein